MDGEKQQQLDEEREHKLEREQYWRVESERDHLLGRRSKALDAALNFAQMGMVGHVVGADDVEELIRHAEEIDEFLRAENGNE